MRKVLITLGDSWPIGAELGTGQRYGERLAQQMQYHSFYNYGSGGASNEDMLYQLQTHIAESMQPGDQTTAIFFLTNPARTAHFPRFIDRERVSKEIFDHFHRESHETMRSSATVSALQKWCSELLIDDYYFAGWVRYTNWLPGVDLSKIWAQGKETAADWFGATDHNGEHLLGVTDNPYIRPNFAHPNQLGHNLIADRLQSWIQSCNK
jgi:hypothetical protein